MKRGSRVEESKSRSRMFFSEIDNFSQSDEGSVHQQEGKVKQLSREATKRVFFCRSLVFLIILGTCAAVSSTTYLYLRRAEDDRVQESVSGKRSLSCAFSLSLVLRGLLVFSRVVGFLPLIMNAFLCCCASVLQ